MSNATLAPTAAHAATGATGKLAGDEIPWNPKVRQKKTAADWAVDIIIGVIITAITIVVLYPIWFVVIASFSNQTAVNNGEVTLWPVGFTLNGYQKVFADERIWTGYMNTIVYTLIGTALNLLVSIPLAFALSRREWKARRPLMFLLTFTMYFSGGMIPIYLLIKNLNLLDSMWVFILPTAVNVFNVIIARSFFETTIPEDLHDAAQIDGVGYLGYFFRIVLPLSSAILAVIGLYYFVQHWNDYFTGLLYIRQTEKQPLQNVLQAILLANQAQQAGTAQGGLSLVEQQQLADQIKYGVILVSTLPLLIIYPFLQKYFNKGVMIGAVKG